MLDHGLGCGAGSGGVDRDVVFDEMDVHGVFERRAHDDVHVIDGCGGEPGSVDLARRQQIGVEVFEVFGPQRSDRQVTRLSG